MEMQTVQSSYSLLQNFEVEEIYDGNISNIADDQDANTEEIILEVTPEKSKRKRKTNKIEHLLDVATKRLDELDKENNPPNRTALEEQNILFGK